LLQLAASVEVIPGALIAGERMDHMLLLAFATYFAVSALGNLHLALTAVPDETA
jgi:hypothetical protein